MLTTEDRKTALLVNLMNYNFEVNSQFILEKEDADIVIELLKTAIPKRVKKGKAVNHGTE